MKGLLLKDFIMAKRYLKAYLLIVAVFLAVSIVSDDNMFFVCYPCILSGAIPVNLLSYDERSKWNVYSGTLPYTKAQLVSAKYLVGIIAQLAVFILTGICQAVRMNISGAFHLEGYLSFMTVLFFISCAVSSLNLPIMFKFGVEKGRIAYWLIIGAFVVLELILLSNSFQQPALRAEVPFNGLLALMFVAGIALYALSWYVSILFYKKREE